MKYKIISWLAGVFFSAAVYGQVTEELKIGSQVWMTKNLSVDHFRNGDRIAEARTDAQWKKAAEEKEPVWCHYENDPANDAKYGKLYNWYALYDPRGLAPKGWHLPSDEEWTALVLFLGGESKAYPALKSKEGWTAGANGSNSSGFSGLPAGNRDHNGLFGGIGKFGFWWSTTEDMVYGAWARCLLAGLEDFIRDFFVKGVGLSVRCIKD